jgi:hypothetical protein
MVGAKAPRISRPVWLGKGECREKRRLEDGPCGMPGRGGPQYWDVRPGLLSCEIGPHLRPRELREPRKGTALWGELSQ